MKRTIPTELITEDMIKNIFDKNSDKVISDNLSDETISSMADLMHISCDSTAGKITNIRSLMNVPTESLKLLFEQNIINSAIVRICEESNNSIAVIILIDGKLQYSRSINKHQKDWKDYSIDDLGSGKASDGTIYLSLAIIEDDDDVAMPIAVELAVKLNPDGTSKEVGYSSWNDSETLNYYIYDEKKEDFVLFQ